MTKADSADKNNIDTLPILWVRSMFDLQNVTHANLEKMASVFIPYSFRNEEDLYFHDLHDNYQAFTMDLVSHWSKYNPWAFLVKSQSSPQCEIIRKAIAKEGYNG